VTTAKPSTSAGGTGACTRKWWCLAGSSMSITLVLRWYGTVSFGHVATDSEWANLVSDRGRMWW
jgi:hypothetical protein